MKSQKNWFNKIFQKEKELAPFLQEVRMQKLAIIERKNCFLFFLNSELASLKDQIENQLAQKKIISLQVSEHYGLFYFIQNFLNDIPLKVHLRLVNVFKDAEAIALILLKELEQKPAIEPLEQLEKFVKQNKVIFVLENIKNLPLDELKILLESLKSAQVILINYNKTYNITLDNLYNIEILPLSSERAGEFALGMLKMRNDLILTSADKKEIISLINNCDKFPEIIFMALTTLQNSSSSSLGAYTKKTQNLLAYLLQKYYPPEINYLLQIASYLPSSGFTVNDLFVLCSSFISSKEEFQIVLFFLENTFCLRKINDVYQIPDYLKQFLANNYSQNLVSINNLLARRIESNYLWKEKTIWITQLEQALTILDSICKQKNFATNQYLILYIQAILLELGFWKIVQNTFIPLCQDAIKSSENNEDRGFWYSLLGLSYLGISRYKDSLKQLDLALNSFQKSLKFYDPQKQPKRYSFVYQNIGLIQYEIYQNNNSPATLKLSLKAYYKALNEEENSITIRRLLAQNYLELAKYEKPNENYQKCFALYKQALSQNSLNNSSQRLIHLELENLYKKLNTKETDSLKAQIKEILSTAKSL